MNKQKDQKIGMIVQNYYAIDSRVRRQAEALVDEGYSVDVIALNDNNKKLVYQLNKVKIYQVPLRKKRGKGKRYLFEYIVFFLFGTIFQTIMFFKKKYRIIHVHNMPDILVFTAIIPKLFGAKVILDIHDPFPELFATKFNSKQKGLHIRLLNFEEKVSIKFSNYVITTTDLIRSLLVQKGVRANKICTILNAPDNHLFDRSRLKHNFSSDQNKNFTLLFAGLIAERNGLGNVVNSLPLLIDKIPNIKYRIIGEGDYIEDLSNLVKSLRVQNFVEFQSRKGLEEIPYEILKADAVVWIPLRNEFIDIVLSVKVLEALAMGKPVITVKTRCQEHYLENEKIIFTKSSDKKQIADAILKLFENYDKFKPTDSDTIRFRAKFNWDVEKIKYYQLISKINEKVN